MNTDEFTLIEQGGKNPSCNRIELFENFEIHLTKDLSDESNLFRLQDVCTAIEYTGKVYDATKLISDEYKCQISEFNEKQNRNYDVWYITEFGIYEFLGRTNAPKAKVFQKWVFEVIQKIRKTGSYTMPGAVSQTNELATICSTILAAIQSQSIAILQAINTVTQNQTQILMQTMQEEAKTTRHLIDSHYGTINNLIGIVSENQVIQKKQNAIESYIVQSVAATTQAVHSDKFRLSVREFANSLNLNCNANVVTTLMKKQYKCSYRKGTCVYFVEDLQEFYSTHQHLFTK